MASGVNKVILIGNLGRDPEITTFDGGTKKAQFPLATTESYKKKDGQRVEQTEWHNIILWRGLVDVAEKYLKKGNQVYIEGRIRYRKYEDMEGNTKYTTEITADFMTMLGGNKPDPSTTNTPQRDVSAAGTVPQVQGTDQSSPFPDDDLPF